MSTFFWQTNTYYSEIRHQHSVSFVNRFSAPKNGPIRVDWRLISVTGYLWIGYNLYTVARENLIFYSLKSGDRRFFSFDLVAAELDRSANFDGLLYFTFGAMNAFNAFVLYALIGNRLDPFIVSHLAEIVVHSWRQFFAQNPALRLRLTPLRWSRNVRQLASLFAALRSSSTVQVSCADKRWRKCDKSRLRLLPEMDRKKFLLLALADEIARINILVSNAIMLIIGSSHYMLNAYSRYSIFDNIRLFCNFVLQCCYLFDLVKRAFFLVFTLQTICLIYLLLFREVHRRIRHIATIRNHHGSLNPFRAYRKRQIAENFARLEPLRAYHHELTQFITYMNSRFFAPMLFVFTITSLPSNVYLLTYSMVYRIFGVNRMMINAMLALHWIAMALILAPMALLNRSIHSFSTSLVPLIATQRVSQFDISQIRQKLKLAMFYEYSLPAGNPHAFLGLTFPPVGALYFETIFRGIAFYVSYIMFMLNLLQSQSD